MSIFPFCTEDNPCELCKGIAKYRDKQPNQGVPVPQGKPATAYQTLKNMQEAQPTYSELQRTVKSQADSILNLVKQRDELRGKVKAQEDTIHNLSKQRSDLYAWLNDRGRKLDYANTLVKEMTETIRRKDGVLASMAVQLDKPKPVLLPNTREFEACLEFARTVATAKDKLMMTRTKP